MVGLDIGSDTIAVVELRGGSGGIELASRPFVVPTPQDSVQEGVIVEPDVVGATLKDALREHGVRTKKCVSSVGGQSSLVVRITEVPRMTEDELKEAMQWDVERHIPFPADSIIVDYQPIERPDDDPNSPNMEVLLVVAQEDMINAHVDALHAAGLTPIGIDVEPLAASRALVNVLPDEMGAQTVCIMNIGAATTDITLVRQLILSFVRPIPIAGDSITRAIGQSFIVENEEADRLKKMLADVGGNGGPPAAAPPAPDVLAPPTEVPDLSGDRTTHLEIDQSQPAAPGQPAVSPSAEATAAPVAAGEDQTRRQIRDVIMPVLAELMTEIRRSLDFYRRQHRNEAIDRIFLIGGTASLTNLATLIRNETGIATEIGNPYLHISCDPAIATPEYLRDIAPVTTIAAGLAMRDWVD